MIYENRRRGTGRAYAVREAAIWAAAPDIPEIYYYEEEETNEWEV